MMSIPSPFAVSLAFIGRGLRHTWRDSEALILAILLPTLMMLLFTFVFGGAIARDGSYVSYVVPGIILLCAGFGAFGTAVGVAKDMQDGLIDRFRTLPIHAASVLTGHVVASLTRNLVATTVVVLVALLVGFRPAANLGQWLAAVGLIALYMLTVTWLATALGLAVGSPEAASGATFSFLFLPYLSSAFVPTATMPGPLRWFAERQPVTPITETVRALLNGGSPGGAAVWAVGWCLVLTLVFIVAAAWCFRHKTRG